MQAEDRRSRIAVVGSINMDLVVRCDALPAAGQTVLAESSMEFCGGKGANQAVAAAAAGGQISMIGAVGFDAFADRLIDHLSRRSIVIDHVARRKDQSSGLAVIAVDQSGQNSIMVVPGANATVTPDDVLAAKSTIEQSDILMVQLEIPLATVCVAVELARHAGVRVILDPAPAPTHYPREMLHVDLLCPNETEAAALTGLVVETIDQAHQAAVRLHELGAANVAITLGDRGTLVHQNGQSELIPPFAVTAVDTTAAGDAFAGALAVRWCRGDDLAAAVRFANAAGALAASRHGAQASMATEDEIETLCKSNA